MTRIMDWAARAAGAARPESCNVPAANVARGSDTTNPTETEMPGKGWGRKAPGLKAAPARAAATGARFRLVRFFTIASLVAFLLVGAALTLHERGQAAFFDEVQAGQSAFFTQAQERFAKQQREAAHRDLVSIHESGSVNVARVFANALWATDLAPFAARVQSIPFELCQAMPDGVDKAGIPSPTAEKKACFAEVGARIRALPDFKSLDAKVFEVMRRSTVFKIKVYDLRGLTFYSSEPAQMGEDKSGNPGFRLAARGTPASKLSHRDKFSAFEGVVNDRDLLESYIPVTAPGGDQIVAVFEVYSDVTPFLARIKATAEETSAASAANLASIREIAATNLAAADAESIRGLLIVCALLVILFSVLFLVVRRADRIIASQAHDRELMQQQLGQSEKMSALGQMVAGVAHQLNTPLAFTQSNVSLVMDRLTEFEAPLKVASRLTQLVRSSPGDSLVLNMGRSRDQVAAIETGPEDVGMMREMLRDVLRGIEQMSELVVNMREFTRLDRASEAEVDINHGLKTVAYMARSVISNQVRLIEEYGELPQVTCNLSQLNQVFLNLISNAAQAIEGTGDITVRSHVDGPWVRIDISDTGCGIPPEVLPHIFETFYTTKPRGVGTGLGLSIALEIVHEHGGDLQVRTVVGLGTTFSVLLPARERPELKLAA